MTRARDLAAFVSNADGDIKFDTDTLFIDSSANRVGIRKNDPQHVLDVEASESGYVARIVNNKDDSQGVLIRTSDSDTGQYILDLQSSSSATGTDYASKMVVEKGGNVGIGTTSPSANLHVAQSGNNVALYAGGGGYNFQAKFESSDAEAGIIIEDNSSTTDGNRIGVVTDDMTFITANSERMRILGNGRIALHGIDYGTFPTNNATVQIGIGGDVNMRILGYGSSHTCVQFKHNGNTTVGSIVTAASSTTYNTSSDYRLKENIQNISDGITRVKQLSPKRFNFIVDADTTVDGFLAHEAATVVPEAVTGVKDGLEVWTEKDELPDGVSLGDNKLDDDGNTIPEYQGIDQSKLVPLLTAALKEAIAKIETLETEMTSVKARLDALEE